MRELRIEVRDADPAYVEEKVGAELYVHLRAVPRNVELRRRAIERAYGIYKAARADEPEPRRGAFGLLVLQRAMLAVEDLGGLLYAYAEPPDFGRLVSYDLADISGLFDRLLNDRTAVPGLYGFPTLEAIEAEPGLTDEQRRAMGRLRAATLAHVRQSLATVRHFWLTLHFEAKKTMHGVGFIAGHHALAPPGAGMVSALVDPRHVRPFAVTLDTHVDHATSHVNTKVGTVDLSAAAVGRMRDAGLAACTATEIFAAGRLHGLQTNHAYTLPRTYLDELEPAHQLILAPFFDD
jgi:hypothetical protein